MESFRCAKAPPRQEACGSPRPRPRRKEEDHTGFRPVPPRTRARGPRPPALKPHLARRHATDLASPAASRIASVFPPVTPEETDEEGERIEHSARFKCRSGLRKERVVKPRKLLSLPSVRRAACGGDKRSVLCSEIEKAVLGWRTAGEDVQCTLPNRRLG